MIPRTSLRKALSDPRLLGNTLKGESWKAWRTLLIASMGEKLTTDERKIFTKLTQREREPGKRVDELVVVAGRRGGKSRAISVLISYLAALCQHPSLVPGETGTALIFAPDRRQAGVLLDYISATLTNSLLLSQLVTNRTQDTLTLSNHVAVTVRSSDFRRIRGSTSIAVAADELAFLRTEEDSSCSDKDVLDAVRPGLATTSGPLFLISSPYSRKGELFRIFTEQYRPDADPSILVAHGASRDFNPSLPQSVIDRALERDHAAASAEYLAIWRSDIDSYVSRDVVDAAVVPGRYEVPPLDGVHYIAFTDPSGGSGDSFTLAIVHQEGQRIVVDCVRERHPPFQPDAVVAEFAATLKSYNLFTVKGDRYGGAWPRERFAAHGIDYRVSDMNKSDYYQAFLPILNSGRVELLDHKKLVRQLCALERRTARGGRDSVDHPSGQHDDVANSVAGAVVTAVRRNSLKEVPVVAPVIVNGARATLLSDIPGGSTPAHLPSGSSKVPAHYLRQEEPWRRFVEPYFVNPTTSRWN